MSTLTPTYSRERFQAIGRLSAPIILGMGSQNVMNLIDTMMVGTLGKESQGAVGIASMALWVVTSIIQGIGPAVQAVTARRLGEKQFQRLHESIVNALYFIVLLGIPYSWLLIELIPDLFGYLSSDPEVQRVGTSYATIRLVTVVFIGINFSFRGYFNGRKLSILYMQTLLMMHPINILLNYLLIFGAWGFPKLGADGAALGTAIATVLGSMNYLRLLTKHRNEGFSLSPRVLSGNILTSMLRLAIPNCLQSFTLSMGFLIFFRITAMVGTAALAANTILINLALTCILIALGLGIATITLVGNAIGEKRPDEAKRWVKATLTIACISLGVFGLVLAAAPAFWVDFFTDDPEVIRIAVIPLILLGLSQPWDAAAIILMHAHLGGGASKAVMAISFVNQWLVFLPGCFVWVAFFDGNLLHLWICMISYRFLLFLSFLVSMKLGFWIRWNL